MGGLTPENCQKIYCFAEVVTVADDCLIKHGNWWILALLIIDSDMTINNGRSWYLSIVRSISYLLNCQRWLKVEIIYTYCNSKYFNIILCNFIYLFTSIGTNGGINMVHFSVVLLLLLNFSVLTNAMFLMFSFASVAQSSTHISVTHLSPSWNKSIYNIKLLFLNKCFVFLFKSIFHCMANI